MEGPAKCFQSSLQYLTYTGLWPTKSNFNNLKWFYLKFLIARPVLNFILFVCICHLYLVVKHGVDINLSEDIAGIMSFTHMLYASSKFAFRHKKWRNILNTIADHSKFGVPDKFEETNAKLNRWSKIFYVYCIIGILIYGLIAKLEAPACEKLNKEKHLDEWCGFFSPIWLPFDARVFPINQIIFTKQLLDGIITSSAAAIVYYLCWEATMHIILRINHLKRLLIETFDETDEYKRTKMFHNCLEYHKDIIALTEEMNACMKTTSSQLAFVSALIFGCIGNHVVTNHSVGSFCHLMGYVTSMFFICDAGQKIYDESLSINDAIAISNWYKADNQTKKDLQLMILRIQKPLEFQAIPFGILNYPLFVTIIKTSYSYLTLMNSNM